MEAYKKLVVVVGMLMVAAAAIGSSEAANSGSGQAVLCGMTTDGFRACRPSVSGSSPLPPSIACCSALSNADMQCFCFFKNSRILTYYGVDPNLAMQLPAKCQLDEAVHC